MGWQSLRPNPVLRLVLKPGMDITMVVILDTMEDTTDGVDIMDTLTDTDIVTSENALLMLNPKQKLKLPLKLKPPPGTDTTVDTTVILTTDTDMDMLVPMDTMVVTGGNLSARVCHIVYTCHPLSF